LIGSTSMSIVAEALLTRPSFAWNAKASSPKKSAFGR